MTNIYAKKKARNNKTNYTGRLKIYKDAQDLN